MRLHRQMHIARTTFIATGKSQKRHLRQGLVLALFQRDETPEPKPKVKSTSNGLKAKAEARCRTS
jgi:hypothetical protein